MMIGESHETLVSERSVYDRDYHWLVGRYQLLRPAINGSQVPEIDGGDKLADTEYCSPKREPRGSWDKRLTESGTRRREPARC
jgi:hypothetical protein